MEKATVKGFRGVLLNPRAVLAVFMLVAITCILSYAVSGVRANTSPSMISPGVPTHKTDVITQVFLNESQIEAEIEQPGPGSAANNPVDDSRQSGEYKTVLMRVTAYCPCEKCCGEYSDGVTASGHKIRPGDAFVAADKEYPFGTKMVIEGYKNSESVKVLDRGGAIRGNKLDVFFHSHREALKWGVRYLDVEVRRN